MIPGQKSDFLEYEKFQKGIRVKGTKVFMRGFGFLLLQVRVCKGRYSRYLYLPAVSHTLLWIHVFLLPPAPAVQLLQAQVNNICTFTGRVAEP